MIVMAALPRPSFGDHGDSDPCIPNTYFSQCAALVTGLILIHAPFFLGGTSLDPNGSNLRIRAIFSVSQFRL
jgi:hypothetical protein